jgi:hypothetical protein
MQQDKCCVLPHTLHPHQEFSCLPLMYVSDTVTLAAATAAAALIAIQ